MAYNVYCESRKTSQLANFVGNASFSGIETFEHAAEMALSIHERIDPMDQIEVFIYDESLGVAVSVYPQ